MNSLKNLILEEFQNKTDLSVKVLSDSLLKKRYKYSLQGIYKEVNKLVQEGVLVKNKKFLSVSIPWVLKLIALSNSIYSTQCSNLRVESILKKNSSKTFLKFSNLLLLQDFWIEVIFLLLQNSKTKIMYQWLPHPWFQLTQFKKSVTFARALNVGDFKMKSIIGEQNYLDKEFVTLMRSQNKNYECNFALSKFSATRSEYFGIIDKYLITAKLDEELTRKMEDLYSKIKSADDPRRTELIELLSQSSNSKLIIEKNTSKYKKIKKYFAEYF